MHLEKERIGKSTTTVNLAIAMKLLEKSVGILDADVYGPSQPRMMGGVADPRLQVEIWSYLWKIMGLS